MPITAGGPLLRADLPPTAPAPRISARADRYERPALGLLALLAAVLCLWGLDHSTYHAFYASAVRSMTDSPADFFYGSFDPAGSITLDKLPGFLWPQALSALVFGFHPWALVLPQALEMVGCVLLLHLLVRRWAGVPAGLLAAAFFTFTPVTVGLGRSVTEDAPFVLLLLLAAEATWRASERARPRTLLLAGLWVGLAFQCKMLEAWAVLPALAVTYLVAAPAAPRRRIAHVALAGAVTVAVSLSWMLAVSLTPAGARPYLDGTTDDSPFALVVGYNFLTRFQSVGIDAAGTGSIVASRAARAGSHLGPGMGDGVGKMFSPGLATQTGWLYPLAALGLVGGLLALRRRRAPRTDRLLAGYVLWGGWLATFFTIFSFGSVTGHTYYMGVVAVAVAALAGAGVARARRPRVLAAVLAVDVAWCVALTLWYPRFQPWAAPCAVALGLFAALLAGLRRPPAALAAALASVLLIPAVWTSCALSPRYNQPGAFGRVGPTSTRAGFPPSPLGPQHRRLLAYLTAHRDGARYLAALPDWSDAAPYIITADAPVLPMGGFTGHVPYPAPAAFHHLLDTGRLRYVVLTEPAFRVHTPAGALVRWTAAHCTLVPRDAYDPRDRSRLLYDCGPAHQR
ncbi:ArnT family glycosyltransferase [Streptomyces alanosinicus]|uniref:Glycosyl transferase n=1 Tax=Streptomyces alanosinicus TaxID=68171 RepID=A0A918YJV7_9ACTN|nr:glycosyltransferase family 39 protein [Streptomyces alanosinicus]GHE05715.1 glycosyl transferase [Streptomyces alanosinicus]